MTRRYEDAATENYERIIEEVWFMRRELERRRRHLLLLQGFTQQEIDDSNQYDRLTVTQNPKRIVYGCYALKINQRIVRYPQTAQASTQTIPPIRPGQAVWVYSNHPYDVLNQWRLPGMLLNLTSIAQRDCEMFWFSPLTDKWEVISLYSGVPLAANSIDSPKIWNYLDTGETQE